MNAPNRIARFLWLTLAAATVVFVAMVLSGNITWFSTERPLEFLDNMDHQFKAIPQSANTFFADRASVRPAVEGTLARGQEIYPLGQGDIDKAEVVNVNPGVPKSDFVLARGQNRFNVFCSACHGYDAHSNPPMVKRERWLGIPNLTRPETAALSDARIYHIISAGQNLMPSYADKISPTDRWAIVYYLRTLQGVEGVASNPTASTQQAQ
jgi:mono/diheme cytochrome c family protein